MHKRKHFKSIVIITYIKHIFLCKCHTDQFRRVGEVKSYKLAIQ